MLWRWRASVLRGFRAARHDVAMLYAYGKIGATGVRTSNLCGHSRGRLCGQNARTMRHHECGKDAS